MHAQRIIKQLPTSYIFISVHIPFVFSHLPSTYSLRRNQSSPPSITNLNPLPGPLIVAAQHRPAGPVRLDQGQLKLSAQHAELRLFGVDRREQRVGVGVAFVVGRRQVEGDGVRGELDLGPGLVDFLEVERDVDGGGCLVEIVPVRCELA